MQKNLRVFPAAVLAGLAMFGLVGCDQVETLKSAKAKLEKLKDAKTAVPEVQGSFSRDQISNLLPADHANFISRKNALVIVDFHAEWCGPCKQMGPVLEKAAEAHPGVVFLGKVDVDHAQQLAAAQGVSGIPDVRFYQDGREVGRLMGFPGEKAVMEKVATLAAGIVPSAPATVAQAKAAKPEVEQFSKGWLPPGMSRGEVKQPQSNQKPQPVQRP